MPGTCTTGREILRGTALGVRWVVLEIGGKDPAVVFGDTDMEWTAVDTVRYSLCNINRLTIFFPYCLHTTYITVTVRVTVTHQEQYHTIIQ